MPMKLLLALRRFSATSFVFFSGMALLAALTAANIAGGMHHAAQMGLFFGGLVLLIFGLAREIPAAALLRREMIAPLLIALIGFALRTIDLEGNLHLLVDEMNTIGEVQVLRYYDSTELLFPMTDVSPFPYPFAYGQYLGVEFFGRNLTGLRMASVVTGTLTLLAAYGLARLLYDRKTALAAMILLAAFPPHLHMSRLALLNIVDGLLGTLTAFFLIRGFQQNRRADFVYAGAALGLTHYFYEGGRLFFTPFFAGVIFVGALLWGWRRWSSILLSFVTSIIIAAPLYLTWVSIGAPLAGRLRAVGVGGGFLTDVLIAPASAGLLQALLERVASAFLLLIAVPEQSPFYNGPFALILPFLAPFFLAGLFFSARDWRTPRLILFLWVFVTCLANGILLVNSAALPRYMGLLPVLMLLSAAGLAAFCGRFWKKGLLPLACLFALIQAGYYFGPHLDHFRQARWARSPFGDIDDLAFRAAALPAETEVVLIVPDLTFNVDYVSFFVQYLSDEVIFTPLPATELNERFVSRPIAAKSRVFFIAPDDKTSIQFLRQHFTLSGPVYSPHEVPLRAQFLLYYEQHP